jgi:UrcA family protein
MNTLNRIVASIALASLSGIAFGAATSADPPQRTVSYADLNLSHPAGAATLYSRIKSAARAVCEPQLGIELITNTFYKRCVEDAIGRAVADVNAPVLAALYRPGSAQ